MADNIIYVPIQINGGETVADNLLERELFVLENGTLYVGCKKADGSVEVKTVVGNVIPNATIDSPTIKNKLIIGDELVVEDTTNINNPEHGRVVFVKNK
jgi:hypothetical protein